ncbi:MAG: hypothetical protein IPG67_15025 [Acidobacteria bacterium]|nr:hypothetical protein [Acidobacteriota bacterium]
MNLGNSIVAGNTAPGPSTNSNHAEEIRLNGGTFTSAGFNLVGDSPGDSTNNMAGFSVTLYQPSDIRDINPSLGPLSLNGGSTPTRAALFGSPAIDSGSNALAVDPSNSIRPLHLISVEPPLPELSMETATILRRLTLEPLNETRRSIIRNSTLMAIRRPTYRSSGLAREVVVVEVFDWWEWGGPVW